MGGVDRADQMAGLYEVDRKSTKLVEKSSLSYASIFGCQCVGDLQGITQAL